jgi:hypothetical protein
VEIVWNKLKIEVDIPLFGVIYHAIHVKNIGMNLNLQ